MARPHGYDDKETLMRISGRQLSSGDEGAYTLSAEERGGIYLSDFKKIVEVRNLALCACVTDVDVVDSVPPTQNAGKNCSVCGQSP